MKKLVSICLVLVLAIGLLTVPAYAQDTEVLPADLQIQSGEDALELACQIWPEYEDKLTWKDTVPLARNAVAATNEVVIEKTHHLSENESITYVYRSILEHNIKFAAQQLLNERQKNSDEELI